MQEFNEGDLVEAVKGETVIRGRVKCERGDGDRPSLTLTLALRSDMLHLTANGYTLTVIEKAAPKLPSEYGNYLSRDGGEVLYLGLDGSWSDHATYGVDPKEVARKYAPLVRLEPVPVTAKKVLDAVRNVLTLPTDGRRPNGEFVITASDIEAISATFGVTE